MHRAFLLLCDEIFDSPRTLESLRAISELDNGERRRKDRCKCARESSRECRTVRSFLSHPRRLLRENFPRRVNFKLVIPRNLVTAPLCLSLQKDSKLPRLSVFNARYFACFIAEFHLARRKGRRFWDLVSMKLSTPRDLYYSLPDK